jgi:hypothetical protein
VWLHKADYKYYHTTPQSTFKQHHHGACGTGYISPTINIILLGITLHHWIIFRFALQFVISADSPDEKFEKQ